MGGDTEGANAKSFPGRVMLIQQLWAFPLIQMLCKELAQGPKLMHLYSLQPHAWTNEWLGSFKQSRRSFFSQGKCTYRKKKKKKGKTVFQLIKPVCTCMPSSSFFPALLPRPAHPQGNQTIKDCIQIFSPSLHVFHPCDCVSEGDVLPLSSKSLILMYNVGLVLAPWPCVLSGDDWQERKVIRLEFGGDRTKTIELFKEKWIFSVACKIRILMHLQQVGSVLRRGIKCPIH